MMVCGGGGGGGGGGGIARTAGILLDWLAAVRQSQQLSWHATPHRASQGRLPLWLAMPVCGVCGQVWPQGGQLCCVEVLFACTASAFVALTGGGALRRACVAASNSTMIVIVDTEL